MNLIIHDLNKEEWAKISGDYSGWNVVTDNGAMHPCIGCFSCWNRTPGVCAVHDGYENMGSLIHEADEVVVISRYTYGGFSGSVKNVFDRCLGYVLPQFEVAGEETHHKRRYDEDKPFTFIFYGPELSADQKASAERYVQAVCNNIRGHVKRLEFRVSGSDLSGADALGKPAGGGGGTDITRDGVGNPKYGSGSSQYRLGRTVILNGSMRNIHGNSAKLARALAGKLRGRPQMIDLKDHMQDMGSLAGELADASRMILCVPLYVDGLPSQVIRLMEMLESYTGESKQIYVLANMGLYESSQLVNLFSAVRQWCEKCGFEYCGGLGVSAGELLGTLMEVIPLGTGATKKAAQGLDVLAEAITAGRAAGDIYAEPYRFPRSLYIWIANTNWNRTARRNGIKPEDMYRRL